MHTRRSERNILKRKLESGTNVHMPAPRRIGKTWTINRLAEDLRKDGWLIVELDVQGMSNTDKFARSLCQKIQGQLPASAGLFAGAKKRLENLTGGTWETSLISAIGNVDPVDFLDALLDALANEDQSSAVFVDEIAFFVLALAERDASAAKDFFYQLRSLQSRHSQVRWLYTGSIGLNIVAERFGLGGAFVDFETFILNPYTMEEARSFIRDHSIQVAFNHRFHAEDEDLDHVFNEIGWLAPFYLQRVANEVQPSGEAVDGVLTATRTDLEAALERLLQPNRKSEFAVWGEHIDKNLPKSDQEVARVVLDKLSRGYEGETRDTLLAALGSVRGKQLRDVLSILENDGLIETLSGRHRFRSGLIRRYWKEYEAE